MVHGLVLGRRVGPSDVPFTSMTACIALGRGPRGLVDAYAKRGHRRLDLTFKDVALREASKQDLFRSGSIVIIDHMDGSVGRLCPVWIGDEAPWVQDQAASP